jgi:hypothetical protein
MNTKHFTTSTLNVLSLWSVVTSNIHTTYIQIKYKEKIPEKQLRFTLQTLLEVDVGSFLAILGTADTAAPPL